MSVWTPLTLAERLWIERLRLDLTIEQFAHLSGVRPVTVTAWEESGASVPQECWDNWSETKVDRCFLVDGLPCEGQLALLEAELLPALVERRIRVAVGLLPPHDGCRLVEKLASRFRAEAAR